MNMCSWGLRCASDSELAAAMVKHSVAIRVTSPEYLQFVSTRRVLHRLLRICKAYVVVVDIWVPTSWIAGTPFRRIDDKLGSETGDLAMTYKLVIAAVGLCRHTAGIGDRFSCKWSNGNELWNLLVVRNLVARCGISFCLDSTAAVGQQFVDCKGGGVLRQVDGIVLEGHRSVHWMYLRERWRRFQGVWSRDLGKLRCHVFNNR